MNFSEYQEEARKLDIYPKEVSLMCHIVGLGNEAGEVLGKLKKQIRDKNSKFRDYDFKKDIKKELGDVLWYLANTAEDLDVSLEEIAIANITKLKDRKERGKLQGSGDDR